MSINSTDLTNFTNEFSEEVWKTTYKDYGDETVDGTFRRVAKAIASVEKTSSLKQEWEEKFYDMLSDFKVTAAGRIYANAGTEFKGTTLINCFVGSRPTEDIDSLDGIMKILRDQAQTLKSEGGWGMNFSFIRPRGAFIYGIGVETPGSVKYMEIFDKSSEIVTAGSGLKSKNKKAKGKIRKGAMMGILDAWHPDVEEFITAKQTSGRLTKFNMSVNCNDEFMAKITDVQSRLNSGELKLDELESYEGDKWDLVFPETTFEKYKKEWDGNIKLWKDKGYPINVYKTISAYKLWETIMSSTYNRNEPGVLFLDNANRTHCWNYGGEKSWIAATNPCVAEGTLVNTPDGYKKVEDIDKGSLISTLHPNGFEPVESIEKHDDVNLFKVVFSDGGEQIVTAAHRYHVQRKGSKSKFIEKIRLDQLKIGDFVQVEPIKRVDTVLCKEKYEKGLMAGILLGDGCYTERTMKSSKSVKIASSQDDESYNDSVKKLFLDNGYQFNADWKDSFSKSMNMIIKKGELQPLLDYLGLPSKYSFEKSIPLEYINDYSLSIGLINGLLATDGNVNLRSNHPQIRFFTTSDVMARQMRMILLNLGVHGRITSSYSKSGVINGREIKRKHTKYAISVSGFDFKRLAELCYFNINESKREKIKSALYNCKLSGNSRSAEILSIEPNGTGTVYDLYCKESDSWITEGYVQQGCGEQALPFGGCCNLLSINLVEYFDIGKRIFDFKKLQKYVRIATRFADNVNDYSNAPLPEYTESLRKRRRIGMGVMGWGSLLYMMKIRFASPEAEAFKVKLMETITYNVTEQSVELAIEKGMFDGCDPQKHSEAMFWDLINLPSKTKNKMKKHGIRNSALFSIQPTGNTSIFANIVSGGCEPLFMSEYVRTCIVPTTPDHIADVTPKFWQGEMEETEMFKFIKEGDDKMLKGVDKNGVVYKIDSNRGLTKEILCEDYAVKRLKELGEWDKDAEWACTTLSLSSQEHITDMKGWYKWIDSSISKTVNLPNDYKYEDFKNIYLDMYSTKIAKGLTTYRAGTMATVLNTVKNDESKKTNQKIVKTQAIKRPSKLEANIHHAVVKGIPYYVVVGMIADDPYEVFTGENSMVPGEHSTNDLFIPKKMDKGVITKKRRSAYELTCDNFSCVLTNGHSDDNADALTRMISTSLRHGADISFIVHQLEKTQGELISFSKALARTLKKYIPDGTSISGEKCPECNSELIRYEGCIKCKSCMYNKCA